MGFEKLGPIQGHATVATCRPSRLGHDNFIGIRAPDFFFKKNKKIECRFLSPVDIGNFF